MNPNIRKFSEMRIGKTYETHALLLDATEKVAKNGKPYVVLSLCDGDQTITAREFGIGLSTLRTSGILNGDIVKVVVCVEEYCGKSYNVKFVAKQVDESITRDDFLVRAPINVEEKFAELLQKVGESHVPCEEDSYLEPLSGLTSRILIQNKDAFVRASAAKSIHHNVIGGLLLHTITMVEVAEQVANKYQNLDRELLICGTALHDIGKITEMQTDELGNTSYTPKGRLLGHSAIGIMLIHEASQISGANNEERVLMLEHMLAAHHGVQEYGAIVNPAIREAFVLHALDMIDSKTYTIDEVYKSIDEGTLSPNIYGLGGQSVYRPYQLPAISDPAPPATEPVFSADEDFMPYDAGTDFTVFC